MRSPSEACFPLSLTKHRALRYRRLVGGGFGRNTLVILVVMFTNRRWRTGRGNLGIPVRRYKVYAFTLSGLIAGFGGVLAVARLGAAGPTLGQDLLLNSLAAIVVGGTSLSGGHRGPGPHFARGSHHHHPGQWVESSRYSLDRQLVIKGAVVIAAVLISQNRRQSLLVK